jgi:hypothetical protein
MCATRISARWRLVAKLSLMRNTSQSSTNQSPDVPDTARTQVFHQFIVNSPRNAGLHSSNNIQAQITFVPAAQRDACSQSNYKITCDHMQITYIFYILYMALRFCTCRCNIHLVIVPATGTMQIVHSYNSMSKASTGSLCHHLFYLGLSYQTWRNTGTHAPVNMHIPNTWNSELLYAILRQSRGHRITIHNKMQPLSYHATMLGPENINTGG